MDDHGREAGGAPVADGRKLLGTDPVCGMQVFEKPNAVTREHDGATYFFCCAGCAAKFDADPGRFLANPGSAPMKAPMTPMMPTMGSAPPAADRKVLGIDPVCGMKVSERLDPITAGRAGTTYFFCCAGCAAKFTADPGRYLQAPGSEPLRPAAAPASRRWD